MGQSMITASAVWRHSRPVAMKKKDIRLRRKVWLLMMTCLPLCMYVRKPRFRISRLSACTRIPTCIDARATCVLLGLDNTSCITATETWAPCIGTCTCINKIKTLIENQNSINGEPNSKASASRWHSTFTVDRSSQAYPFPTFTHASYELLITRWRSDDLITAHHPSHAIPIRKSQW